MCKCKQAKERERDVKNKNEKSVRNVGVKATGENYLRSVVKRFVVVQLLPKYTHEERTGHTCAERRVQARQLELLPIKCSKCGHWTRI